MSLKNTDSTLPLNTKSSFSTYKVQEILKFGGIDGLVCTLVGQLVFGLQKKPAGPICAALAAEGRSEPSKRKIIDLYTLGDTAEKLQDYLVDQMSIFL